MRKWGLKTYLRQTRWAGAWLLAIFVFHVLATPVHLFLEHHCDPALRMEKCYTSAEWSGRIHSNEPLHHSDEDHDLAMVGNKGQIAGAAVLFTLEAATPLAVTIFESELPPTPFLRPPSSGPPKLLNARPPPQA